MPRQAGLGALIVCVLVGLLFGTVTGELMGQFISGNSVVYMVLVETYRYTFEPVTLNGIAASLTFGFGLGVNGFSIVGVLAGFFYWKNRI